MQQFMKFMNENSQILKFINENMAERSFDLSTLECLAWFQFNASAAAPQSLKQRLKYPNINIPYYSLFAVNILFYHDDNGDDIKTFFVSDFPILRYVCHSRRWERIFNRLQDNSSQGYRYIIMIMQYAII